MKHPLIFVQSITYSGHLFLLQPKKRDLKSASSIGAMDMGGASLEIAFQTSAKQLSHNYTALLFGEEYKIYSRSFLCFGLNEAFRRTLAYLVQVNMIDSYRS